MSIPKPWCMTPIGGYANSERQVELIASGVLDLGFGPVDISNGIDWRADPFSTRMWGFRLHNLQWLYNFYSVAHQTGDRFFADKANSVIASWVSSSFGVDDPPPMAWDQHVTALRARVLACSVAAFEGPFEAVLREHAKVVADTALAEKPWNHGTDGLLTLLTIGCALGDDKTIQKTTGRLSETIPVIVDDEGVSNEQSPTYDYYVYSQLEELDQMVSACGLEGLPGLERRHLTPEFLAHATRPDGRWAHLGDTTPRRVTPIPDTPLEYALSKGQHGIPPEDTVGTYSRGYVFGRSGWGTHKEYEQESWYSIRFGPGRQLHGHRDHTSFTWYALGRPLIVDSGFSGYDADEFREYERSEFAHNQVVVDGLGGYREGTVTILQARCRGASWESYLLRDEPYDRVVRQRSIHIDHDPPLIVVQDDLVLRRKGFFTTLLHLPADTIRVESSLEGYRVELPPEPTSMDVVMIGTDETDVFQGWSRTGGWIGEGLLDRRESPVIMGSVRGRRGTLTTVLVPTMGGKTSISRDGRVVEVQSADHQAKIEYDPATGLLTPVGEDVVSITISDGRRPIRGWSNRLGIR